MSEHTKKTQITVDDVVYDYEDLTPEQQELRLWKQSQLN